MARQPRGTVSAGVYHVTLRSAGPIPMFTKNVDCHDFCRRLSKAIGQFGWECLAFCLMPTHYHLLLDVDENRLQPGMHQLNGQYAQAFNRRHRRSGHLHGDRYHLEPVTSVGHLLHAVRYIARNPVRDGLCRRPEDWLWSSYRGTARLDGAFAFVKDAAIRDQFGGDDPESILALRIYVERD